MTVESVNRLTTTRYKLSSFSDEANYKPASKTRYRTRIEHEHEHEHEHDFENHPIFPQPPTTNPLPTPTPKLRALRAFVVKPPRAKTRATLPQKNSPSVPYRVLPWPTDARHSPKTFVPFVPSW